MKAGAPGPFGAQLRALREAAGYTQEELATIAGLSVHAISALEGGARRRPHVETVRALSAALDVTGATRDAFVGSAREPAHGTAVDELRGLAAVTWLVAAGRAVEASVIAWGAQVLLALAEFKLLVLLAALRLGPDEAYTVSIADHIEERTGRAVRRANVYTTLQRLEGNA